MTGDVDTERARRAAALHATASSLAQAGRLDGAIPLWGEALQLDPTNVDVLVGLGHALAAAGQRPQARDLAERAARSAPSSSAPWLLLGHVAFDDGDAKTALEAYALALERAPDDAEARTARARVLLAVGRVDEAEADLARAGDGFDAWMLRGRARAERGDLAGARDAFARAGDQRPTHPEPYKQIAALVVDVDPQLARELLTHALQLAPKDAEARALLARLPA